jgi:hypothetical protein
MYEEPPAARSSPGSSSTSDVADRAVAVRSTVRSKRRQSRQLTVTHEYLVHLEEAGDGQRPAPTATDTTLILIRISDADGNRPEFSARRQSSLIDASSKFFGARRPEVRVEAHFQVRDRCWIPSSAFMDDTVVH